MVGVRTSGGEGRVSGHREVGDQDRGEWNAERESAGRTDDEEGNAEGDHRYSGVERDPTQRCARVDMSQGRCHEVGGRGEPRAPAPGSFRRAIAHRGPRAR
jgi:hypothetical protein